MKTDTNEDVNDGTYIGFMTMMFAGVLLACCLCNAKDVVRDDGSRVIVKKNPSWKSEFRGLWRTLCYEPYVIALFPMFFASNWFYTYQQNGVNGAFFTTRAKAMNSMLYWLAQIIAAFFCGIALDSHRLARSTKARLSLIFLMAITLAVWLGGLKFALKHTRASLAKENGFDAVDYSEPDRYLHPVFLYTAYGAYDAVWQATVYW